MSAKQKDNSTFMQKKALRLKGLAKLESVGIPAPIIMESHGGSGALFDACYSHLREGVVFETDDAKVNVLARQRPSWSVYQGDCETALAAGIGGHLTIDLLDVDPYGSAFEVLDAFFSSQRPFAKQMVVAVNDGARANVQVGGAWRSSALEDAVLKYGNDLWDKYLTVCKELLATYSEKAGYRVSGFGGYYCGAKQQMTHYLAWLEQG